jgi:hypothetical protein
MIVAGSSLTNIPASLGAQLVSPETKARFRSFAERQQMSESALLKRLVDLAMRGAGGGDEDVVKSLRGR